MKESEGRKKLLYLVDKFLLSDPGKDKLVDVINDSSRPGLPIRAVLEHMRKYRSEAYSDSDKELIDELIYNFG